AVDAAVLRPQAGTMAGKLAALKRDLVGAAGVAGADHQITAALRVARDDHQAPAGRLKLFDPHGITCRRQDRRCIRHHIDSLLLFTYKTYATHKLLLFTASF